MEKAWYSNSFKDRIANQIKKAAETGDRMLTQLSESQRRERLKGEPPVELEAKDIFRKQLPALTGQLVGSRLNTIGQYVAPVVPIQVVETFSEYIFERTAELANSISSTSRIAKRAGVDDIFELRTGDISRCDELVQAVLEENRMIALTEGGLTGATGLLGALVDLPLALFISLRAVYQIAHCYGFDLEGDEGRKLAFEALSHSDLELLVDKQGVLLVISGMKAILESGDLSSIEKLMGGSQEVTSMSNIIGDLTKSFNLRKPALWLSRTMPFMTGAAGATYNARLITSVITSAQTTFRQARLNGERAAIVQTVAASLAEDRAENRDKDE
ncbi:MAG: EcsC family protein [Gammaproteobacteria bacterium]|nr:EcsC family protein [Gammaproteobacteria bacterium]